VGSSAPFLPEVFSLKGDELADTTALLFGRRSYEAFAPYWRESDDHAAYRDLPKYVLSTTLTDADLLDGWGPTVILRSTDEVADLKRTNGGGIFIHGSAEAARRLAEVKLIDRYNLLVFPVLLGAGKRLFSAGDEIQQRLTVRESEAYANGVLKVIYDVHSGG
jgi:dihydrofolate reductase